MRLVTPWTLSLVTFTLLSIFLIFSKTELLSQLSSGDYANRLTQVEQQIAQRQSSHRYQEIMQRLDRLEKTISISLSLPPEEQTVLSDYLSSLEQRQNALEDYVYESFSISEDANKGAYSQKITDNIEADSIMSEHKNRKQLNKGLTLLDKSIAKGELDESTFGEFNQIVSKMDNEGNKQLWERLFAGIQSGKYQMPDSEPIHDHTYLPDGEVIRE